MSIDVKTHVMVIGFWIQQVSRRIQEVPLGTRMNVGTQRRKYMEMLRCLNRGTHNQGIGRGCLQVVPFSLVAIGHHIGILDQEHVSLVVCIRA